MSTFLKPHEFVNNVIPGNHSPTESNQRLFPTIFHETWWLESTTRGRYSVAEVESGGRIVGRLPYQVEKNLGLKVLGTPLLTYFLGPAIDEGEGSANNRFLKRLDITRELIHKLPPVSSQYIKCHRAVTDIIAFQEQGFRSSVQFTHEIDPQPPDILWKNMRNKTRNVIRRAQEELTISESSDPTEFVQVYQRNILAKGLNFEGDADIYCKTIEASLERRRGRILLARDKNREIIAATHCVWDNSAYFYLLSTRAMDSGNGAISLLLWESMKDAAQKGLIFDLAGLATRGSVLLYAGLGGELSPRYIATRSTFPARMIFEARNAWHKDNFFF